MNPREILATITAMVQARRIARDTADARRRAEAILRAAADRATAQARDRATKEPN